MTTNENGPQVLETPRDRRNLAAGEAVPTVAHDAPPHVPGRLDTYRSRSARWHRQVRVDQCPRCGHPHLHRAPLAIVQSVLKLAPCGLEYLVVLRTEVEAA